MVIQENKNGERHSAYKNRNKEKAFRDHQEVKVGREGTPVPFHTIGRLALKDCHRNLLVTHHLRLLRTGVPSTYDPIFLLPSTKPLGKDLLLLHD